MRRRRVATASGAAAALTAGMALLAPTGAPLAGPSDYGGPYPGTTAALGPSTPSSDPGAPDNTASTSSEATTTTSTTTTSTTTTSTTTTSTTTTSTTTSTSTTSTTTTTVATTLPPLPLTVAPPVVTVGRGGVATISGTCPETDGVPLGPVTLWEVGDTIRAVPTGVTAAAWTYDWRAPAAADADVLQVWCGDPATWQGGYPVELQIRVVYVAQAARSAKSSAGGANVDTDAGLALPASR